MTKKNLHIASCDKFIPPFIEMVLENFDFSKHAFYLTQGMSNNELKPYPNVKLAKPGKFNHIKEYLQLIKPMHKSKKIILHSLFNSHIVVMLFFMPWLLKKSYWVIWGGDLYSYNFCDKNALWKIKEFFRKPVIKNMGYLVTYIEGDVNLGRKWYGARGEYVECLMYPSNLYKDYRITDRQDDEKINILVGNSSNSSNNHDEIFDKLIKYEKNNIRIYVPLTYGDVHNKKAVVEEGKKKFGDKFIPITEHMPFSEYLDLLAKIDVAIFNHRRQQAMGNTITLLGLGKKVFMRTDVAPWKFFSELGVSIFDVDQLSIDKLSANVAAQNKRIISGCFSEVNLRCQLSEVFK